MAAFVITLGLMGALLLWLLGWERRSRLAIGFAIGAILALVTGPTLRTIAAADPMPVWLPALPFALIAFALFAFGMLAWSWGEQEPRGLREQNPTEGSH
jgi:hypothetical protein